MQKMEKIFTYHKPKKEQERIFVEIRAKALDLGSYIDSYVPEGKEREMALTKLEEVVMWANAAVARNPDYL